LKKRRPAQGSQKNLCSGGRGDRSKSFLRSFFSKKQEIKLKNFNMQFQLPTIEVNVVTPPFLCFHVQFRKANIRKKSKMTLI
jgi:hypothetical protein